MRILPKYITRQTVITLFFSVCVFTFVLLLSRVLKDLSELLVNRQVGLDIVVLFLVLMVPSVLSFSLPMSMLTAALLVFGEDPLVATANLRLTGGVEFMLVVDHFMTATAAEADVVLPASLPAETDGSFTACDRRVQKIQKLFEPVGCQYSGDEQDGGQDAY
jgi:hypothetical protein